MENKEQIYDEQIAPLMSQIIEICKKEGIPMYAEYQYAKEGFCTTLIGPEERHMILDLHNVLGKCREGSGFNMDRFYIHCSRNYPNASSIVMKLLGKEPETQLEKQ